MRKTFLSLLIILVLLPRVTKGQASSPILNLPVSLKSGLENPPKKFRVKLEVNYTGTLKTLYTENQGEKFDEERTYTTLLNYDEKAALSDAQIHALSDQEKRWFLDLPPSHGLDIEGEYESANKVGMVELTAPPATWMKQLPSLDKVLRAKTLAEVDLVLRRNSVHFVDSQGGKFLPNSLMAWDCFMLGEQGTIKVLSFSCSLGDRDKLGEQKVIQRTVKEGLFYPANHLGAPLQVTEFKPAAKIAPHKPEATTPALPPMAMKPAVLPSPPIASSTPYQSTTSISSEFHRVKPVPAQPMPKSSVPMVTSEADKVNPLPVLKKKTVVYSAYLNSFE